MKQYFMNHIVIILQKISVATKNETSNVSGTPEVISNVYYMQSIIV